MPTTVYDHWNTELRQRWGSRKVNLRSLGGKAGGRELNHSSDVDLIFVYRDEGQLTAKFSYHEWFTRLGNKRGDSPPTRPVRSSASICGCARKPRRASSPFAREHGKLLRRLWRDVERLALIKARWICGDRELAYDFLRQLQPFIAFQSPTPDLLDEVAAIKIRIERDIVGYEHRERT